MLQDFNAQTKGRVALGNSNSVTFQFAQGNIFKLKKTYRIFLMECGDAALCQNTYTYVGKR